MGKLRALFFESLHLFIIKSSDPIFLSTKFNIKTRYKNYLIRKLREIEMLNDK